jgi:hypothetical protein
MEPMQHLLAMSVVLPSRILLSLLDRKSVSVSSPQADQQSSQVDEVPPFKVFCTFYDDGSGPALRLVRGDCSSYSFNEKYDEQTDIFAKEIVTSKNATTLEFRRALRFTDLPFFIVHSDLQRSYLHQPWARGVLPIFHVDRLLAFSFGPERERGGRGDIGLFRFDVERAKCDVGVIKACLWICVQAGVGRRDVEDVFSVLRNIGVIDDEEDKKRAKAALEDMAERGLLKLFHNRAGALAVHESNRFDTIEQALQFAMLLANAFEPYLESDYTCGVFVGLSQKEAIGLRRKMAYQKWDPQSWIPSDTGGLTL